VSLRYSCSISVLALFQFSLCQRLALLEVLEILEVSENHEGNQSKISGGISANGCTIPPLDKIPPSPKYRESRSKPEIDNTLPFIFLLIIRGTIETDSDPMCEI